MIADIRHLLEAIPFQPFYIVTSSGIKYRIASRDHIGFNPQGSRVLVWFDDGSGAILAALHIVSLEQETSLPFPGHAGSTAS